ncbi:biopolymer transport ExbD protein [Hymenobacter frigidus]|uniref:Biopolymer transport ExbD protein n=2 Tax=Hymenobacter frigidus TaxID=1524095 RepID=A0ABQ2A2E5_9BACT|nr:biopolymer transport ExbD protein [Hymenobacter frigidus]
MSTRIDMTPMVDLAFLLLTFFMLTTTFARPYQMELNMPVKSKVDTPVRESTAMTILLGKGHRVHYFFGLNTPKGTVAAAPELHTTNFTATGIRQAVRRRQQQGPVIVLIKSSPNAKYQDLVDILDEMNRTHQQQYALVKITQDDLTLLNRATL